MKCKISSKSRMNAVGRAFESLDIIFLRRRILGTTGVYRVTSEFAVAKSPVTLQISHGNHDIFKVTG